ncbi:MAG: energy-coupling factor transporter transmembrane protein EcfT [Clostridiales bacterium]|nr:energy-coupling factor transporter transmembrane protein EcfT [Clostridiales bacterium]
MRDIAIGQYYPVDSVMHRLDPRVKILAVLIYIVTIFFIDTFIAYGGLLLFLTAVILLSHVPPLKVLKSLRMIVYLVVFTVLITLLFYNGKPDDLLWQWWIVKIYRTAIHSSLKMALRIMFLIVGPTMLTFTTTPVALTDGVERLLAPLKLIRVPVHSIAMIMSIALRLIPTLVEEMDKIKNAQKARGADFDSKNIFKRAISLVPVLIPLFVSSFRRANDLADAMDSRCYRGAKGRTRMKVLRLTAKDFAAMLIMAAVLFMFLWLNFNFFPGLVDFRALPWFV